MLSCCVEHPALQSKARRTPAPVPGMPGASPLSTQGDPQMRRSLAIAGAAFACAAVGTPVQAQGSGVDQQSACMSARMGAGVGSPCNDASGVYFSPGGLAMQGSAISLGVTLIRASNTFRYDPGTQPVGTAAVVKREPETVPVPQAFASIKVSPRVAAAIG